MEPVHPNPECPLAAVLQQVGDRWSLVVLRDMILDGKRRHAEFLNAGEGLSAITLGNCLLDLQYHGLVEKFPDPQHPGGAIYLPTEKGIDLLPLILEAIRWGLNHQPGCEVSPEIELGLRHGSHDLLVAAHAAVLAEREALAANPDTRTI